VKRLYASGPLAQRGLLVLVDPQPPFYPVLAEIIEAISHSSLVWLRIPSVIASLGTTLLLFFVGKAVDDIALGLWLAALISIGTLAQVYAGIGRPYAVAQCAIVGCLYAFVLTRQRKPVSPGYFLLAALLAQSTQWIAWAIIGPMVLYELAYRFRAGTSLWTLVKQFGWYGIASGLLLVEMAIQLKNPTVTAQSGIGGASGLWKLFTDSSPFLNLDSLGSWGFHLAGILFAILVACGVASTMRPAAGQAAFGQVRAPLVVCLVCSVAAMVFVGASVRFMMTYTVMPTIFAGIGIRRLARLPSRSDWAVAGVTAFFFILTFVCPEDPYRHILPSDTNWDLVGKTLASKMKSGDVWTAWPYFWADCLYRSGPLPTPALPQSREELLAVVRDRPAGSACFVLSDTADDNVLLSSHAPSADVEITTFSQGFVLLRVPPAAAGP
jgi:hypothetical protein